MPCACDLWSAASKDSIICYQFEGLADSIRRVGYMFDHVVYSQYINGSNTTGQIELFERTRGNVKALSAPSLCHLLIHLYTGVLEFVTGTHCLESTTVACTYIEEMEWTLLGEAQ